MYCVRTSKTTEETIKKSRFIGVIVPCENRNNVITALNRLAADHPNASHIAFAYRLKTPSGIDLRYFDAGEPAGTAGKPIFQHLEGKNLINCLVAVIRYFGGIKLGAGGLTRAYGNAAKQVIESSSLRPFVEYSYISLHIDYKQLQSLEYQLKKFNGKIVKQEFSDNVKVEISLPTEYCETLQKQFAHH